MLEDKQSLQCRHFVTYTGVTLPLRLITPLEGEGLDRRLTYFRGYYNAQEQLVVVEKIVYSEVEFEHHYEYHDDGRLKSAKMIEADDAPRIMEFN